MYIIRKRALGDVLWVEPVIREMAGRKKKIIFYTKIPQLFENYDLPNVIIKDKLDLLEHLYVRICIFLNLRSRVINLEMAYESNPKMHILHAYLQKAGLPKKEQYPVITILPSETEKSLIPKKRFVILHIESTAPRNYRKVYGVDWNLIAASLKAKGLEVIQIGLNPVPIKEAIHLKTSIREMIALISKAHLFIGIDSGPSHVATSLRIPSLLFFGAVLPEYRHFLRTFNGKIMQSDCEYLGCYHDTISKSGPVCRKVGNEKTPPCAIFSNENVLSELNKLI